MLPAQKMFFDNLSHIEGTMLTNGAVFTIDDYTANVYTKVVARLWPREQAGGALIGGVGTDSSDWRMFWYLSTFYFDYASSRIAVSASAPSDWFVWTAGNDGGTVRFITPSGSTTGSPNYGSVTTSFQIGNGGNMHFDYIQIYESNALVKDIVTVKKNDGTVCLYDKLGKKYYYTSGSPTFTKK